jgi:hypothetical protein
MAGQVLAQPIRGPFVSNRASGARVTTNDQRLREGDIGRGGPHLVVDQAEPNEEAGQSLPASVKTTNGLVDSQILDPLRIPHGLDSQSRAVHRAAPPSAPGDGSVHSLAGRHRLRRRADQACRVAGLTTLAGHFLTQSGSRFHRLPTRVWGRRR